jgi:hypothetical protein
MLKYYYFYIKDSPMNINIGLLTQSHTTTRSPIVVDCGTKQVYHIFTNVPSSRFCFLLASLQPHLIPPSVLLLQVVPFDYRVPSKDNQSDSNQSKVQ